MVATFTLPGLTEPEITIRRGFLGSVSLYVDGTKVPQTGSWRPAYVVPLPGGQTRDVTLSGLFGGLKASVDGVELALEPPVHLWEQILVLLPIGLAFAGGVLGAVIGVLAIGVNGRVMRSGLSIAARTGIEVLSIVIAVIVWVLAVTLLRALIAR